jgi:hypothetical protein
MLNTYWAMGLNLVVLAVGNGQPTANDREFFQRAYYKESHERAKVLSPLYLGARGWLMELHRVTGWVSAEGLISQDGTSLCPLLG